MLFEHKRLIIEKKLPLPAEDAEEKISWQDIQADQQP